ncbi:MAG TPA: serine hydrolase domain-containing protein [Chitinophagaceae bacterium]|nr:serine hydrolase domain-containing protein [Chitinophagaceae bacterium]
MKKYILFLFFFPFQLMGQALHDSLTRKIDSLFSRYTTTTPGCAVAIIKNEKLIFKKGYGMANLEYNVPITPSSIFHIASESKQYVAFCMLLLEQQGKLSIDDDIRKYLEYVPDFGKKITIRHLIHHTSGLRDQWQLLANAGWQLDDVITQEHIIKLVSKQKALNFGPGEEQLYCNTGYTLLAEIVKKASGLSLREYTDKFIFKPLEMSNTHFHDNYREIVPNRTYSYAPGGSNGYSHSVLSYSTVGATSLFTTVEDEAKWLMNYEHGKVGGKDLLQKMYSQVILNNGKKLTYAFAINMGEYNGWKEIGHGGGDAGFRTYATRFPEQQLGIIVFSNLASFNSYGMAMQVAELLLPPKEKKTDNTLLFADSNLLKKLVGRYVSSRGAILNLSWNNGKLLNRQAGQTTGGTEWKLVVKENNQYQLNDGPFLKFETSSSIDSVARIVVENPNGFTEYFRQPLVELKKGEPAAYAGTYYNEETEAAYTVIVKDGDLFLQHRKFADAKLSLIGPDQFSCPNWWMSNLKFLRDNKGVITGFEVNAGRVLHLLYIKKKPV